MNAKVIEVFTYIPCITYTNTFLVLQPALSEIVSIADTGDDNSWALSFYKEQGPKQCELKS